MITRHLTHCFDQNANIFDTKTLNKDTPQVYKHFTKRNGMRCSLTKYSHRNINRCISNTMSLDTHAIKAKQSFIHKLVQVSSKISLNSLIDVNSHQNSLKFNVIHRNSLLMYFISESEINV